MKFLENLGSFGILTALIIIVILFGIIAMFARFIRKIPQGKVLVRNGLGGTKVSFDWILVLPILHRIEIMDISVKRIEIERSKIDGLVCMDNLRADIKVVFFVRVNPEKVDVLKVAKSLGCDKASDQKTLTEFFDAKFSEALKTVGKKFDFVQLYTNRDQFKHEILQVIGTDLNGYLLDDAAIDYLEQTDKALLNPDNILDAEGIKKITDLTAQQAVLSNQITRDKEKTIVKQDVGAREAILELEKQLAEAEEKQKKEVLNIKSRQEADAKIVSQEERLKSETARIQSDEEIMVAEENKERQIIVAQKAKESTERVETERVEKMQLLEKTEKEKLVTLANIEKEKAVEEEKKNIQEEIRERVIVEKAVVVEEEKIKDTRAFAEVDRTKQVAITTAEKEAQESLVMEVKAAEAQKKSSEFAAEKRLIEADAHLKSSEKDGNAMKIMADARAQEDAVHGLAEARVQEAKADAIRKEGEAKAQVVEMTAEAEAKGIEVKALADAKGQTAMVQVKEKDGNVEADIMYKKYHSEADGITEKANAMKLFDEVGKEHEEFKLKLDKDKQIDLAGINARKDIASNEAEIISEALKHSHIDIVGGDMSFFEKITGAITQGKSIDRMVDNSKVLENIQDTFLSGDSEQFKQQLSSLISKFNIGSEDLKNLTISALLAKMIKASDIQSKDSLQKILAFFEKNGMGNKPASSLI